MFRKIHVGPSPVRLRLLSRLVLFSLAWRVTRTCMNSFVLMTLFQNVLSFRSHVLCVLSLWDKKSPKGLKWNASTTYTHGLTSPPVPKTIKVHHSCSSCSCSPCPCRSFCCIWRLYSFYSFSAVAGIPATYAGHKRCSTSPSSSSSQ